MIQQATYAVPREDLGEALHEYNPAGEGFIATEVLPIKTVRKKAATVSVITRENLKRADVKHANGSAFNRINMTIEDLAYACIDRGLEGGLTDDDRENYADDFDAELETTMQVERHLLIEQEIRVATMLFNTSTWTGAPLYTDNSAAPWDAAGSAVIAQILAAKEMVRVNTGYTADSMLIGPVSMQNLLLNTGIRGCFVGVTILTEAMLRANIGSIFGIQNLYVGNEIYDSALEGQTFVGADIWSDDYALVFKKQVGPTSSGGLGRSILWDRMSPGNITVAQYREEQTESDIFRARHYIQEKVFDAYFAHLMKIDA